jgi:cell division protein ZapA (FtsZ GTPase activity inhibitor)
MNAQEHIKQAAELLNLALNELDKAQRIAADEKIALLHIILTTEIGKTVELRDRIQHVANATKKEPVTT